MSSLLEEAIVDAKALKDTALKNAENTVLEKYSGEVKRALDTLFEQDEGLGLEEEMPAEDPDLTEFINEVPYGFQNEELDEAAQDEIVEINFDALKQRLEEEEEVVEGSDMIDATALAEEIVEEGDGEDPTFKQMADDERGAEISTAIAEGDEDEDINLTEEMLSDLIEELVVDMNAVPQGWSSVNSADNSIEQANNMAITAAQASTLEEDEELEEEVETAPDVVSSDGLYESKNSELTKSNRELRALVIEAKTQLTQLNLDNAKLVYQNKALNSASLNERQKQQIVEAVQSANSVEETGMIFETIQNAVGSAPVQRTRPQTLREAVQRPTSLLINSQRNSAPTKDPKMDRMLRLAGLNK